MPRDTEDKDIQIYVGPTPPNHIKVAICLSGMCRNIYNSYNWLQKSILDVLEQNDIQYNFFLSLWSESDDKDIRAMFNLYELHLKGFEQEIWDNNMADFLGWQEFKNHRFEIEPRSSCLGMFYKIWKCNELRKKWEKDNNSEHDIIIRTRNELHFNNNIDVEELKILSKNQDKPIIFLRQGPNPQHIGNKAWTKDNFSIMNKLGAEIYCETFNHLLDISKFTKVSTAELILRNWLYSNNVDIYHTSCDYRIIRRKAND